LVQNCVVGLAPEGTIRFHAGRTARYLGIEPDEDAGDADGEPSSWDPAIFVRILPEGRVAATLRPQLAASAM
jgi:hypothetical protein